ncbi:BRAIN PROTEIN 44/YHR162W(YEAST) like protein, putative [Babesia bigemina]|uniref:Mitochondrial pyruvate carrier n=1 Tax=Babesia bigemina TaxID=5866 RepID=A0A061DBT9_BABBI|nr:BRAIN PROTEIN 44/YHR162W(YEAST) like protein, putative [Babesia bigemina]CDR96339.1 BRAIN PROTEIN 44/YHR162W(YEAST) like protein, putative [Babesia bigemina]|eukprot:XP_012768525.1 BRAIN PROTEIN 44/YHR162W(YEAST) like protein, putative [Babesia bigemina]
MLGFLQKVFYPGVVPVLQAKVLALPLPEKAKAVLAHPAGPFTIHFYAPTFKWGISIANLADINRPTDKLSLPQQLAVSCTGIIWSRYSTVITPVNYNLLAVNAAMAVTGVYQISRICRDRLSSGKPLF